VDHPEDVLTLSRRGRENVPLLVVGKSQYAHTHRVIFFILTKVSHFKKKTQKNFFDSIINCRTKIYEISKTPSLLNIKIPKLITRI